MALLVRNKHSSRQQRCWIVVWNLCSSCVRTLGSNTQSREWSVRSWNSVRGLLRNCKEDEYHTQYVYVNRCSDCGDKGLEKQTENYFQQDFSERTLDNKPDKSREDRKFMNTVTASVERKDGHYEIALPLRQQGVQMPNNRPPEEHCVTQLNRRLLNYKKITNLS